MAYQTRGGQENVDLLEQAIALRDEQARLLGYPNFSAYTLADRMAATPARAAEDFRAPPALRQLPPARMTGQVPARRDDLLQPPTRRSAAVAPFYRGFPSRGAGLPGVLVRVSERLGRDTRGATPAPSGP